MEITTPPPPYLLLTRHSGSKPDCIKESKLHCAVWDGDVDAVQELLRRKTDIDSQIKNGYTPLFVACVRSTVACARLLVRRRANLNLKELCGHSALFAAVEDGSPRRLELVSLLLRHKADVNAVSHEGKTPLIHSIEKSKCFETVKMLVRAKAMVNIRTRQGMTPLIAALKANRVIVEVLIGMPLHVRRRTHSVSDCPFCHRIWGQRTHVGKVPSIHGWYESSFWLGDGPPALICSYWRIHFVRCAASTTVLSTRSSVASCDSGPPGLARSLPVP